MTRRLTSDQWSECVSEGGESCCIYAAVDAKGFCCLRDTQMGEHVLTRLAHHQMNATWLPGEHCRNPIKEVSD